MMNKKTDRQTDGYIYRKIYRKKGIEIDMCKYR